jgi:hypothetical protein
MAFLGQDYTLDGATQLKDAGLVAADAAAQVGGAAAYFDVGAANAFCCFDIIIDWTACEVASGDELYDIRIQGAEATAFSTAFTLCSRKFGDSSVNFQPVDTSPSGRVVISGNNVAITSATDGNSIIACRYIRVYTDVTGTIATGMNFTAYLVPRK